MKILDDLFNWIPLLALTLAIHHNHLLATRKLVHDLHDGIPVLAFTLPIPQSLLQGLLLASLKILDVLLDGIPLLASAILASFPHVCLLVGLQLMLEQEPLAADHTLKGPLVGMRPHVVLQVVLEDEGVAAEWADVGALP